MLQELPIRSVLVFRALHLGDMLCAIPALRALRGALPHAHIDLLGLPWAVQLAARFPAYLNDVLVFPGHPALPEQPVQIQALGPFHHQLRRRRYDLALQLHGSGAISNHIVAEFGARWQAGYYPPGARPHPQWHGLPYPGQGPEVERLLDLLRHLGAPAHSHALEFPLTPHDLAELDHSGVLAPLAGAPYVCVHPGARDPEKCWPAAAFAKVADYIAEHWGLAIVLTGSPAERPLVEAVAGHMRAPAHCAAGPLSIGGMAALMAGARLLLANDTGVSHLAAGMRLPSVIIFSKADIVRWAPADKARHRCLWDASGSAHAAVREQVDSLLSQC